MLEVELDIFSGMPNPTWMLSAQQEAELLERLRSDPGQMSPASLTDGRHDVGYRGLIVRQIKSDDGPWDKASQQARASGGPIPTSFRLGRKAAKTEPVERWLVGTSMRQGARIIDEVQEVVSRGVKLVPLRRGPRDPSAEINNDAVPTARIAADTPYDLDAEHHETWWDCGSNYFSANAHFFNDPAHVTRNNCYCFASNHMPDIRYARPGRRGGRPATSITCGGCIDGLRADGWKDNCQNNGITIVMVMWPNVDYHFYRLVTGRPYWWWGHKPGGTPAKYTDDCGNSIYQFNGKGYAPNNICRGSYSDFCGYFYQDNATAYVA